MGLSFKALACTGAVLATAACAQLNLGGGAFTAEGDIADAQSRTATGAFNEALRKDYLTFALYERNTEYDWRDAGFHAAKASVASTDKTPAVSPRAHWMLPDTATAKFDEGFTSLNAALDGGGRDKAPMEASRAQTFFECWAEEQEENHQHDRIAYCWDGFQAALKQVQAAIAPKPAAAAPSTPAPSAISEPPARDYLVFFDFDQTAIRQDSAAILDKVTAAMRDLKGKMVELIGHADRAGADRYNQRLSERRAVAVRAYLGSHGIPVSVITTTGKGESDPRVPTPDGVREQENRRVEVHIK